MERSDIVTIHCPLTPQTHHLIDANSLKLIREGAMLINTSRGAVVDTRAVIAGLKSGRIGALGLDVYEEEGDLFFRDLSETMLQDDVFADRKSVVYGKSVSVRCRYRWSPYPEKKNRKISISGRSTERQIPHIK